METKSKPAPKKIAMCACGRVKVVELDKSVTWQLPPECFRQHAEASGVEFIFGELCWLCKN